MTESGEAEASSAVRGAAHGAMEAGLELLDVVFKWIVPLIALVVGFLVSSGIGLSGLVAELLDGVLPPQVPDGAVAIISDLVAIAIWGGIAVALWHVAEKFDGKWAHYVLRPIATLFGGFALGEIPPIFKQGVNEGALAKMTHTAATQAKVGA